MYEWRGYLRSEQITCLMHLNSIDDEKINKRRKTKSIALISSFIGQQ